MATTLKRLGSGVFPIIGLFLMLLVSLYLMSDAVGDSSKYGRLYILLLVVNSLFLVVLTLLTGFNLYDTVRQVSGQQPGSRLTLRLVFLFSLLSLVPVSVVYYFSVKFLDRGVDSWFDVRVEQTMNDALELSRLSLGYRQQQRLADTLIMAQRLDGVSDAMMPLAVQELHSEYGALEVVVLGGDRRVITSSSDDIKQVVPSLPPQEWMITTGSSSPIVGLEPIAENRFNIRVLMPLPNASPLDQRRWLTAVYAVDERVSQLAAFVEENHANFRGAAYLRAPLKQSFSLTLALVLVLSVLFAVWAAFYSAKRLVAPIRELAEGTKAVAAGELHKKLPVSSRDELGFLVRSFNDMTASLAEARDVAERSQRNAESQRRYLHTVLQHLSSGVLTLSHDLILRTANPAADDILGAVLENQLGRRLADVARESQAISSLYEAIRPQVSQAGNEWLGEVHIHGEVGHRVLMCRGARLPELSGLRDGVVLVFDDVTELIRAQRDAAWGEVARRLAHEIKNPLTPIQLSAERMQRKLKSQLPETEAKMLDRLTHTIVQQVEAMKRMVNAFSDYARAPSLQMERLDVNRVIREVRELYREHSASLVLDLHEAPCVEADAHRLRQLLHNLVKNALEATETVEKPTIRVSSSVRQGEQKACLEVVVSDNGPGFDERMMMNVFDPYVTGKARGTGLGLAVVKKIMEEHGGTAIAENDAGARIVLRFPVVSEVRQSA